MRQIIRKYPLSILCIALIWYLSLFFVPPDTPLNDVAFMDKWTHFVMYGGTCAVIWWEYLRHHQVLNRQKLFVWAWLAPTLMGGLVELVQAYCTTNRSGEWIDFMADAFGATIGAAVGLLLAKGRRV